MEVGYPALDDSTEGKSTITIRIPTFTEKGIYDPLVNLILGAPTAEPVAAPTITLAPTLLPSLVPTTLDTATLTVVLLCRATVEADLARGVVVPALVGRLAGVNPLASGAVNAFEVKLPPMTQAPTPTMNSSQPAPPSTVCPRALFEPVAPFLIR